MSFRFSRAIVRPPGANLADGLTTVQLGVPDIARALEQHERYCRALERCGLSLVRLPADPLHPDSTFVEDTAILSTRCNVLTRPGAPSRSGEVDAIGETLGRLGLSLGAIESPGTLDGGDVCDAGGHFFIGISERTNHDGARQLAALLGAAGLTSGFIDIRAVPGILHLKSGIAAFDERRIVVIESLAGHPSLRGYEVFRVPAGEEYAANCVRVNDHLLVAAGFPGARRALERLGADVIELEMSEFQKMDGGLSCLSLRF